MPSRNIALSRTLVRTAAMLAAAQLLTACVSATAGPAIAAPADRGPQIEAHMRFLADDRLEGRDTGSAGYDMAAAYVAEQFAAAGLEPLGDDRTYFQQVPLRRRSLEPGGVRFSLELGGVARPFENGVDIAVDASALSTHDRIDAELVFAGWGITAPELGLDDYKGLDVRGKAVVLLEGAPASLPGALRAHFSWTQQKERMAAAQGAVAVLTVKTPVREKVLPWERTRQRRPLPGVSWLRPETDGARRVGATISLGPDVARDLFRNAGRDIDTIYAGSEASPPRGFGLGTRMRLERRSIHEPIRSANVVALLPGSDPALRDEHILVLSHLDHLGRGPAVNGDTIYNGAIDNAGGIAVMLEAARAIAAGPRPRRSIIFVATTGEEKGLIGSDYLAARPVVPLDRIVAAVSVDGLMAFNDFTGIVALGADHSSLGAISAKAAAAVGAVHVPDPIPERGNLALSDQYPFLRAGIPVLFPNPVRETARPDPQGIAAWDDYESRHYHQPSDDMNLPIRWDSAARWLTYIERVIAGAANSRDEIRWNDGDPLGQAFARAKRP